MNDVYSAGEIAAAAGTSRRRVLALAASGIARAIDGEYFSEPEAVRLVRLLRTNAHAGAGTSAAADVSPAKPALAPLWPPRAAALAASGAVHTAGFVLVVAVSSLGLFDPHPNRASAATPVTHLVFLASPGPGGGGGGGGLRHATPPPPASLKGRAEAKSPIPIRRAPPRARPAALPPPNLSPPPLAGEPLPPIIAPVVSAASQALDRPGSLTDTAVQADSRGPGEGGGAGTGTGTGIGEGHGPGVGAGWGGGYGGGPFAPGSGIEPPRLLHEVKPRYTEAARRAGVEGEVVLEVVVRADGTVGDIRVLRPLGAGLDERAVEAVKQWRFAPGTRRGLPVDVVVEVSVEFRLR